MGLLGARDSYLEGDASSPDEPRQRGTTRRQDVEFLGKKFRIVDEGLDPDDVMEFLEAIAGSSEAAFKRLEQFAAFQTFAQTMNDSITEARQLAERAKAQAAVEAEQEKQRAVAEAGRAVGEVVEQVRRRSVATLDRTFATLQEALGKAREAEKQALDKAAETMSRAREIETQAFAKAQETSAKVREFERLAFEKAQSTISEGLVEIRQSLEQSIQSGLGGAPLEPGARDEAAVDEAASAEAASAEAVLPAEPVEEPDETEAIGDSIEVELEAEDVAADAVESEVAAEAAAEAETDSPAEEQPDEPEESGVDSAAETEDAERLFTGAVTLSVPGGVDEAWVRQLRQRVKGVPGARIREESGGDTKAFTMNLVLDTPAALLPVLASLPGVSGVTESQAKAEAPKRGVMRFRPGQPLSAERTMLTVRLSKRPRHKLQEAPA